VEDRFQDSIVFCRKRSHLKECEIETEWSESVLQMDVRGLSCADQGRAGYVSRSASIMKGTAPSCCIFEEFWTVRESVVHIMSGRFDSGSAVWLVSKEELSRVRNQSEGRDSRGSNRPFEGLMDKRSDSWTKLKSHSFRKYRVFLISVGAQAAGLIQRPCANKNLGL
jgi:hypothetical protein